MLDLEVQNAMQLNDALRCDRDPAQLVRSLQDDNGVDGGINMKAEVL